MGNKSVSRHHDGNRPDKHISADAIVEEPSQQPDLVKYHLIKDLMKGSLGNDPIIIDYLEATVTMQTDKDGKTLLHWAAYHGRLTLLGPLMQHGADIEARNIYETTPIGTACANGHKDFALAMAEIGADPTTKNRYGKSALDFAREKMGDEGMEVLKPNVLHVHTQMLNQSPRSALSQEIWANSQFMPK